MTVNFYDPQTLIMPTWPALVLLLRTAETKNRPANREIIIRLQPIMVSLWHTVVPTKHSRNQ